MGIIKKFDRFVRGETAAEQGERERFKTELRAEERKAFFDATKTERIKLAQSRARIEREARERAFRQRMMPRPRVASIPQGSPFGRRTSLGIGVFNPAGPVRAPVRRRRRRGRRSRSRPRQMRSQEPRGYDILGF